MLKISHEEEFERLVYKNESKYIELGKRIGNAFAAGRALKRLLFSEMIYSGQDTILAGVSIYKNIIKAPF